MLQTSTLQPVCIIRPKIYLEGFVVVLSVGNAIAAHESEDYAVALTALGDGAVREICIVEGTA